MTYSHKKPWEFRPYGYPIDKGYLGRLHDGTYMLFATEGDYLEYIGEVNYVNVHH